GLGESLSEKLKQSFHRHGAAQCCICTPAMLISATSLLRKDANPSGTEVEQALGGVLCRCTGYRKIIDAVCDANRVEAPEMSAQAGHAVGARLARLDGQ